MRAASRWPLPRSARSCRACGQLAAGRRRRQALPWCAGVVLGPARKLVTDETPAVYRSYTYDEYYKKFWSRNLDQEHCLELFRT